MKNFKERRKMKQGKLGMLTRFLIALFCSIQMLLAVNVYGQQTVTVNGTVTDAQGQPLPGATVVEEGTTNGTATNNDGFYTIEVPGNATLVFSFVGMRTQEVEVGGRSTIDVTMVVDAIGIEEVVAVGYGTMRKSDLTGAVNRANIESFKDQPNVSIAQSLQGNVPGLNVGAINRAGQEPSISIRGRTSISGAQNPLIVLDGVIYRGNLIDINPNDIGSIDILKDNSAAAVYGSQASNGVILLTTKTGNKSKAKPVINYSSSYAFQQPVNEMKPMNGEEWIQRIVDIDLFESRTAESGYLEPNPDYVVTTNFRSADQRSNYQAGKETNWDDVVANSQMYTQNHNLSLASSNEFLNYYISLGFADVKGYMVNEDYKRYNARFNIDNYITKWLTIGMQSSFSLSDYSGGDISTTNRFRPPYVAAYKENGELNEPTIFTSIAGLQSDNLDIRNNFFGNIYADISIPFIKGLSYKLNFSNNLITNRDYNFDPFYGNMQGLGSKAYTNEHNMLSDHILSYKRMFNNEHRIDVTLLYGFEKRKFDNTRAQSTLFVSPVLGYNRLQAGASELQQTISGAWEEASLYNMARLVYNFRDKYMITGTVRRDGFSGFSEKNKFGIFPSVALGWVLSEEGFMNDLSLIDYLKIRASYGSTGNRTIGRYQTLAIVTGGFNYINAAEQSVYTKGINSLASDDLKWETTTGINVGIDFGIIASRLSGSIDYYNNNTTDLLYEVDVPSISRFSKFPDNLGKINNYGIDISLRSINVKTGDFQWSSDVTFSRNRDELKELLGFDNDGDGKEDDLISEGLFIGEPLNVIHHYETTGEMYQLDDEIPYWSSVGNFIIDDQNGDDEIDIINDYKILGYEDPSYRFGVGNTLQYKNWSLYLFVNSIQGGKNYYNKLDDTNFNNGGFDSQGAGNAYNTNHPKGYDAWLPENPNARYPRIDAVASERAYRMEQRNFVRLQDVSLSYTFNRSVLEKVKIENLRIFLAGKNLITITNWPGLDPETGDLLRRNQRPLFSSYSFGINLDF